MNGNSCYSPQPEEDPIGRFYTDEREERVAPRCEMPGCRSAMHPQSEGGYCAAHEVECWRDELKRRWFQVPVDFADTAEAEIELKLWQEREKQ